jgi:hypothetical protein
MLWFCIQRRLASISAALADVSDQLHTTHAHGDQQKQHLALFPHELDEASGVPPRDVLFAKRALPSLLVG